MANCRLLIFIFIVASMGLSPASAQDSLAESGAVSDSIEARHFKRRRCKRHGNCNNNNNSFQGGHQGGYPGYPGYQPPINIAVSQSQSSANGAQGGYAHGQYPNNYQYNGGYPNHQYNGGYPNNGYYGGYHNPGYYGGYPNQGYYGGNGHGPYDNGPINNQYNGNYYGPGGPNGGFGFQRPPYGLYYDENSNDVDQKPDQSDPDQQNYNEPDDQNY